jgi:2-dehydro-3-deoxygluconokinase
MVKTVCFGEIMLRLSPPGFERLFQSPTLHASFGGGEANVAVSLAQFGCDSAYVTRLPANASATCAASPSRRRRNVERRPWRRTSHLLRRVVRRAVSVRR